MPDTRWTRIAICSSLSLSPRLRRYDSASGFSALAYTSFTACRNAASRSSGVPWFGQNSLRYFPANALPKLSSRKLLDRAMIGAWP
jgi:hypothetical protein